MALGHVQEGLPQAGQAFPPGQISGGDEFGSQVAAGPGCGGGAGGGPGAGGGAGPAGNHTSTSVGPQLPAAAPHVALCLSAYVPPWAQ